jgi:succinate dehydrogenase/fumarate reductase flavoprotein subunit
MSSHTSQPRIIVTDVLVVGGGGAGFRAAIGAREKGAQVIMVSKGSLARCGASPMAGADLTCHGKGMRAAGFFGEPNDSEEKFLNDILHQGIFLNDQRLAELYVVQGPDRMLEMIEWGIKPDYTDERAVFVKGTAIMDALLRQAKKIGVALMEDVSVLDLFVNNGCIAGALALDIKRGEFILFKCKSIVIATGGWHKAYTPVTGSRELTGDGIAMAYRVGAEVANMEFVTFACNVNYWPPVWRGSIFGYVASLMFGNYLENSLGEAVFDQYDPWMVNYANRTEWNKSFISFVSAKEIRAGKGSPHGGLYYRLGKMSYAEIEARAQNYYPGWKFKGMDFSAMGEMLKSGEGVEVGPGAEYFEGGLAVDENYATNIPGLYAAGEAATSLFGANRVAAATMEMLTTGAIAGWSAAKYANAGKLTNIDPAGVESLIEKAKQPFSRNTGLKPSEIRKELQMNTQQKLSPIRTELEIKEMLAYLDELKTKYLPQVFCSNYNPVYNKSWLEALELENMIQVLELSTLGALYRTESRGVHYREDFPVTDNDQWLKEIRIKRENDQSKIDFHPVYTDIMSPPSGKFPYLELVKRMMQGHSDTGGHH